MDNLQNSRHFLVMSKLKMTRSFVKDSMQGFVWPVILLAKINPRSSGSCCSINCLLFTGQNWFEMISFSKESGSGQQRETNAHFKCIPSCCRFRSCKKILPRKSFLPTWNLNPRAFWGPHPFYLGSQQKQDAHQREKDKS